jgi:hypothetical protein
MVEASCHCGNVTMTISQEPSEITECNCSICRRYGVLWAYYLVPQVQLVIKGEACDTYSWDDRSIAFYRCAICGCVTHWSGLTEARRHQIGVNARLLPPDSLARARLRHLDGAITEQYVD